MSKKITFTCAYCGKQYSTSNYNRKALTHFCCRDCYMKYQREIKASRGLNNKIANVKCELCGKSIHKTPSQIKNSKHLFCSRLCQNTFQSQQKSLKQKQKLNAVCKNCGKKFHKKESKIGKENFCNLKCRKEYRAKQRVEKVCAICGKKFTAIPSQKDSAKYCSIKCQIKHQRRYYKEFECAYCGKKIQVDKTKQKYNKTGLHFCSKNCSYRYFKGEKSPTYKGTRTLRQILRGYFNLYQRPLIFQRDLKRCQKCGKVADHIHHIYPLNKMIKDFKNLHEGIDITKNCYQIANQLIKEIKIFKDLNNLVALCKECHKKEHYKRET